MIFRYYRKIPWHQKNFIFEARFSLTECIWLKYITSQCKLEMAQWLGSTVSQLGPRGFESSCWRSFFSSRTALRMLLSWDSFIHIFQIRINWKEIWHRKFPVTKNIIFDLQNLKADFYNSTYTSNHAIFSKKKLVELDIIVTQDSENVTKFIQTYYKLFIVNTWRWLARFCHIHRFGPQKQQILFVSSAQKSI